MHNRSLAPETIDSRRRYLCRHIFTEGRRCASPAIRGSDFCYYHRAARTAGPLAGRSGMFTMPRIDDRAALQIAIYDVLCRISALDIDFKQGGLLLYGLQVASSNLPPHPKSATAPAPQQPLIEEIDHDFHEGDLAPILEIPDDPSNPPALPPSPAPPINAVILSEGANALESKDPECLPCSTADGPFLPAMLGPCVETEESEIIAPGACEAPPELDRVPIPPSCFTNAAPQVIYARITEGGHIEEEIHQAVQAAIRLHRQPIDMQLSKRPSTDNSELTTDNSVSLPPPALAP